MKNIINKTSNNNRSIENEKKYKKGIDVMQPK